MAIPFPKVNANIVHKKIDNKQFVFCIIRKRWIVLTPEEKVRQVFLHYLIIDLGYSKNRISLEYSFYYNEQLKRADIVHFCKDGTLDLLVECKRIDENLDKAEFQASVYFFATNSKKVVITNGQEIIVYQFDNKKKTMFELSSI